MSVGLVDGSDQRGGAQSANKSISFSTSVHGLTIRTRASLEYINLFGCQVRRFHFVVIGGAILTLFYSEQRSTQCDLIPRQNWRNSG